MTVYICVWCVRVFVCVCCLRKKERVMEGRRIGDEYESGRENDGEKLRDNDHEVLKKMISSHPLYGLLIESHFNCLKVGLGEFGEEFDITEAACKQKENSDKLKTASTPSSAELDQFMEAYCMALSSLKEAIEEPTKETRAFINSMHVELKELCKPNHNNKPQDAIECSSKKNL